MYVCMYYMHQIHTPKGQVQSVGYGMNHDEVNILQKIRSKQKCHINYLRNTSKDLLSSPQFQYDFWH